MRVNSVETESIDERGRVTAFSKTSFAKGIKPKVGVGKCPFDRMAKEIKTHRCFASPVRLVTIRTSQGVFKKLEMEKGAKS